MVGVMMMVVVVSSSLSSGLLCSSGYRSVQTLRRSLLTLVLLHILRTNLSGSTVEALHLTGTFNNKDFFKFLAKFGFQKAEQKNVTTTKGFIFGNITTHSKYVDNYDMYLVVVDSEYFVQYYANRNIEKLGKAGRCTQMFGKIDTIAWDRYCTQTGPEDFLRRIPCEKDKYCLEEYFASEISVYQGYQFTYHIVDMKQPRFWYISLVACHRPRNTAGDCQWSFNDTLDLAVEYDVWFVNGDPGSKHQNPFEHQFSFEMHDVLEIYLTFFILNILLLVVQLWFFKKQLRHALIWLISLILGLEVSGIFFNLVHITIFAYDGEGIPALEVIGKFFDTTAQCATMLELLLIGKGWTITYDVINRRIVMSIIWSLYTVIYIILFIVTLNAVDPIGDVDEWQTIPGYCILLFRVVLMGYFLFELQDTFTHENRQDRRAFYTKFGAGFLVWFIYLPILALISPKIAALWRFKTLLSIQSGADFCFILILVHLLWPGGDNSYFNIPNHSVHALEMDMTDERTELFSENDESSEDELYERQAQVSNSYHKRYASTNGITRSVSHDNQRTNGNVPSVDVDNVEDTSL